MAKTVEKPPIADFLLSKLNFHLLLGLMCLSCVWCIYAHTTDEFEESEEQLRVLRMQKVQAARQLSLLQESSKLLANIRAQPATVELLTIELVEAVRVFATGNSAKLTSLHVLPLVSAEPDRISMDIEIELDRAQQLLELFDVIQTASDWRPIDIRGCSLVRLRSSAGVATSCTIDVFLFAEFSLEHEMVAQQRNNS